MRQRKIPKIADGDLVRETRDTMSTSRKWQLVSTRERKEAIALIDPKALTRQAVIEMLSKAFPQYKAVAVSSCDELPELEENPHLVIVYVRSASAIDGWVQSELRLIRLRMPDVPLAMISDRDDADEVRKALSCGVRGYIPSSAAPTVALAALNLIHAGGTFIPEYALSSAGAHSGDENKGQRNGLLDLTTRELSVVELLREGVPNKRVAIELNMQESTVKVHVRNILKKLNATNRTQAASIANRLLSQPTPTGNGSTGPIAASSRTETERTSATAWTDLSSGSPAVPASRRNGSRPTAASPNSGSTADQTHRSYIAGATHTQDAG